MTNDGTTTYSTVNGMKQLYEVNESITITDLLYQRYCSGGRRRRNNSLILKIMMYEGEKVRNYVDTQGPLHYRTVYCHLPGLKRVLWGLIKPAGQEYYSCFQCYVVIRTVDYGS